MSQQLFKSDVGFATSEISFLSGADVPGGQTYTDASGVGSIYARTAAGSGQGEIYQKQTAGAGTDKWYRVPTSSEIATNFSWREPVVAKSDTSYANLTAAETVLNDTVTPGVIGGVSVTTLANGNRILFTNVTDSNKNVFIVTGTPGSSATLTEDINLATAGDMVRVQSGTAAGKAYAYNGSSWIYAQQAQTDEEGYMRTYIGKTGEGSESPTYSSTTVVAQSSNLETAIGAIDDEIGSAVVANTRTNNPVSDQDINRNIEKLDDAIGLDTELASVNYLSVSNTVYQNLKALDSRLYENVYKTKVTGITTATVIDEWLVDTYQSAKYVLSIQDAVTKANNVISEILVMHNGNSGADATVTQYTEYAKVRDGSAITGLAVTFNLTGSGATQKVQIKVASTGGVDASLHRTATDAL